MTTGVLYLTGSVSRRPSRKLTLPIFAMWTVLSDVTFEAPSILPGICASVLLCLLAALPSAKLRWDALAVMAALAHSIVWLSRSSLAEHYAAHALFTMSAYWILSLAMFAGVHSTFLFAYVTLLCGSLVIFLGPVACLSSFLFGSAVVSFFGVMEGRVGQLLADCSQQQSCVKNLLVGLSDGACTLESQSGIIASATSKLAATFEVSSMEGRMLCDFLQKPADRGQIEAMLEGLNKGDLETFAPRLMSCQTASGESSFEAMVVPFTNSDQTLSIGFRVVGDRKRSDGEDMWPCNMTTTATSVGGSIAGAPSGGGNEGTTDVSFALSWADDAVQMALLAPRQGGAAVAAASKPSWTSIGVQTDAMATSPPPAAAPFAGPLQSSLPGPAASGPPAPGPPGAPPPLTSFLDGPANLPLPPGFHRRPSSRSQGSRRSRGGRSAGSMSSGGSRTCSESSFGSSAGAVGFPSSASCFLDTALLTRRKSIIIAMHHWNLPRNPDACCPWHTAVYAVDEVVRLEARTPCKPLWSPFLGWQCTTCTCVNHPTVAPCNVCGTERPACVGDQAAQAQQPPPGPPVDQQ